MSPIYVRFNEPRKPVWFNMCAAQQRVNAIMNVKIEADALACNAPLNPLNQATPPPAVKVAESTP